jgi:hypothetical protein
MTTPICPKCGNPTQHEFDDTNKCQTCGLFYDDSGQLLCGVCLLPADTPDGWCKECKADLAEVD